MQFPKLRSGILAATLTIFATFVAISPAHAYSVYRGVDADPETGIVIWTKDNFGVSGKPIATLSFFHYSTDEEAVRATEDKGLPVQCLIKVDLGDLDDPHPGATALVGNPDVHFKVVDTDQPKPFPWTIVFDNIEPGHWSIAKAEMTYSNANNAAGRVAAAGFKALATTAETGVTVINGTLDYCRAAQ